MADERVVQAFVQERFVDLFLGQNRRAQAGLLVAALLVAFVWWRTTHTGWALAWLGLAALVTAVRYRYSEAFIRGGASASDRRFDTHARIIAVLLVNGVLMALPLVAFDRFSALERTAVSIILMASATASVSTTSGFRAVFLAFAAPMLLPLAAAWGWVAWHDGAGTAWGLALLIAVYLLFLVSIGKQVHAVFVESCRFRHGEQQLTRELTRALEDASEANRAKTQFLAAASHDLRQPIHSMNVLVAALSLRELEPQSREIVGLLGSVNQTLSKQLDTLLDMSKLDAGVVRAELTVQRLDELVRAHHAATEPVARERGLRLELDLQAEPSVLTDAALLGRTLSNLTDNALKFTPAGGRVRLAVRRVGDEAVLEVADDGIGIAAHEQERVFREFYQVGNVERDRLKGLGLGLSIVRRLCLLLDIQLTLRSAPGAGTTVSLRMPLAQAVAPSRGAALASAGTPRGLRVLVVDDEAMVRQSMRLLLTALGCTVHLADGVAAAAVLAAQHELDVVLSDLRLRGGESGLAAIRAVTALQPGAKAALITGDTAPDRIRDAQAAGVPLLYKPVTLADLVGVLPEVRT